MNLHTNREQFSDAIVATAQQMNISEVLIEKDYWVTYVLKRLSESGYNNQVVFKGLCVAIHNPFYV
jgi:hypothetical protein